MIHFDPVAEPLGFDEQVRERAAFTLERLHLRDSETVIRQRRAWYEMYEQGKLSLEGLDEVAPLIARAIRKQPATPE